MPMSVPDPMTAPFVTALIPAYNAADTIRRAIDSVLAQTYTHREIIVVDDGSRDMTSEIVATEYRDLVRLLRLPSNQGESGAMNHGIAAAQGELVAFLDADDEWLPTKLAKQIELLNARPDAIMVSCACRFLDEDGNLLRDFGMPPADLDRGAVWRMLLAGSFIAKPCVVARTAALRGVGPFDTGLAIAADQDMWIRLALQGPVEFVPEFLTTVHDTAGSLTKVYAKKVDTYVLPMIRRHVQQQRHLLSDSEVREILGQRFSGVGRNLYQAGSLRRGSTLLMRAAALGHSPGANLWYLAAASPPARAAKSLVGYSPPSRHSRAVLPTGSLLQPREQDLVPVPPGPPILIVVIDAEAEFDWSGPFLRTLISVRNLKRQHVVQDIFDRLGVRPTFMVDYAVATQPEGFEPVRELLQSGRCEVGAHLQPWENPPFAEELSTRNSFNTNLPVWLQNEKLRCLTEAIAESMRMEPTAYRAGRYAVGDEIAGVLRTLGYKIDLSVLPGFDLRRAKGPDFRRAFNRPYWFGPDRDLLEIPVTTGFSGVLAHHGDPATANASLYTMISQPSATKWHLPGLFARLGLLERIRLSPEGTSIQELKRLTHLLLRRGHRVFTFDYHSSTLLPGYTPYVRSASDLDRMLHTIEAYLNFFIHEMHGMAMTPSEFHAMVQPSAEALRAATVAA
jgi:hypothetical protein